uniref:Harpin-induced protein n=1 Tax=Rheum australe TaxID=284363 RepID=B5M1Z0_RHEAU|nr:harpin-induced protein [Rheum australe]
MTSYQKQPQLNGAYYGPAIPPPEPAKSSYRPGRGGGGRGCCCLFDCLCDCGCCLLSCVFKIICSIIVAIGILILVVWLIIHPHEPKFHVTDASITTFNYSGNQLSYNLAVNFTIRNSNHRIGIYYDAFEANTFYQDQRFGMVEVDPFFQGKKNTTEIGPVVFKGQSGITLGSSSDFESQKNGGKFDILVRLHLKVRFKLGAFKTGKWKPKVKCDLTVPLSSSTNTFESTKCRYYY